ncbi:hypothetical protein P041_01960, partial [Brucella sp. 04-5288]
SKPKAWCNIRHKTARFLKDYYCDTLLRFLFLDEKRWQVHMTAWN